MICDIHNWELPVFQFAAVRKLFNQTPLLNISLPVFPFSFIFCQYIIKE